MWPINVEVPLRSKMVVREHDQLDPNKKRKKGPAFGTDGVLYNHGRNLVSLAEKNKENEVNK
jgi:hypothetical protein